MNQIFKEDVDYILSREFIDFSLLDGKSILITGATGLIGKSLCYSLLEYGDRSACPPMIYILARNKKKAEQIFGKYLQYDNFMIILSDIGDFKTIHVQIDYIVHAASETSSRFFLTNPVETINTSIEGTKNILDIARENNVSGVVYLSSMEVYGAPGNEGMISEESGTTTNPFTVRASYSEGKRISETMCVSYYQEYGVPVNALRITQTFGPGITYDDPRLFAELCRCSLEKKNIVLHTRGLTYRAYLYTADAVTAILAVLLHSRKGQVYNASNPNTYCSVFDMANLAANITVPPLKVLIEEKKNEEKLGYLPTLCMNLDITKIQELGWYPSFRLQVMLERTIRVMKEECR